MRIYLLAAVVVFGLTARADAQTQSAATVVANVDAFYQGLAQCTASFSQTVANPTFGKTTTSTGKLYLRPGKMRWDYAGKSKKSKGKNVVANGKTLWVVDHENLQIIKRSLKGNALPAAVTFLYGKGSLAKSFTSKLDTSGTYGVLVLELTPKQANTAYATLYLVVDPTTYAVNESVIIDAAGVTSHFRFSGHDYATVIPNKTFKVRPKAFPKYRVVP